MPHRGIPSGWPIYPVWTSPGACGKALRRNSNPDIRYVEIADRRCEQDRLGQKTGQGWYRYVKGSIHLHPNPAVNELIDAQPPERNIQRHKFSDADIMR